MRAFFRYLARIEVRMFKCWQHCFLQASVIRPGRHYHATGILSVNSARFVNIIYNLQRFLLFYR